MNFSKQLTRFETLIGVQDFVLTSMREALEQNISQKDLILEIGLVEYNKLKALEDFNYHFDYEFDKDLTSEGKLGMLCGLPVYCSHSDVFPCELPLTIRTKTYERYYYISRVKDHGTYKLSLICSDKKIRGLITDSVYYAHAINGEIVYEKNRFDVLVNRKIHLKFHDLDHIYDSETSRERKIIWILYARSYSKKYAVDFEQWRHLFDQNPWDAKNPVADHNGGLKTKYMIFESPFFNLQAHENLCLKVEASQLNYISTFLEYSAALIINENNDGSKTVSRSKDIPVEEVSCSEVLDFFKFSDVFETFGDSFLADGYVKARQISSSTLSAGEDSGIIPAKSPYIEFFGMKTRNLMLKYTKQ